MIILRISVHSKDPKVDLPRVGATIFARKKGEEIWHKYRYTRVGSKLSVEKNKKNPYMNFRAEDRSGKGFFWNDIDWMYGHEKDAPQTVDNFLQYVDKDEKVGEQAKVITNEYFPANVYVVFIPPKFHHYPFVIEAKEREMENFDKFAMYDIVKKDGQKFITSGWIITEKTVDGKQACKARLVVHGNQVIDEYRTDSPTVRKASLRLQFFLAAQFQWKVETADITSAFLQSDQLKIDMFVRPPRDIHVP